MLNMNFRNNFKCWACALTALVIAAVLLSSTAPLNAADGDAKTEAEMKAYSQKFDAKAPNVELVPIKGGILTLGSPEDEEDRGDDEGPQVKVKIDPFWMGKYEISWDQFQAFRDEYTKAIDNKLNVKSKLKWDKQLDAVSIPTPLWEQDSRPILNGMGTKGMPVGDISQYSAKQFTKWLSKRTGHFFRLPTEAEWEYACRAGTTTAYWWGDDADKLEDNDIYRENSVYDDPSQGHPDFGAGWRKIGTGKANPWGLYNMHGNVAEWVIDGHDEEHYAKLAKMKQPISVANAVKWPEDIFPRVARGGHWDADPEQCRSASRLASDSEWQERDPQLPKSVFWYTDGFHVGFRVIRMLKVPSAEEQRKYWNSDDEYEQSVIKENTKIIRMFVEKHKAK
jgi:formylglycine-generating enzyme required for sulfatase activity